MAGAMNKANQRQSQKRKYNGKAKFSKIRMKEIPMVCGRCNQTAAIPSVAAYTAGGVKCPRCGYPMAMDTHSFKVNLVSKK